jgi:NAD(P)H-dependent FMN reductase
MQIIAISGSIRVASLNRRLLEEAQRVAPEGITVTASPGLKTPPATRPA